MGGVGIKCIRVGACGVRAGGRMGLGPTTDSARGPKGKTDTPLSLLSLVLKEGLEHRLWSQKELEWVRVLALSLTAV